MLDLLPLVLEDAPPEAERNLDGPVRSADAQPPTTAACEPSFGGAARSKSGKSGLLSRCKSLVNGRRKSEDAESSAWGPEADENFSPLGRGENGASASQQANDAALSPRKEPGNQQEPVKFMDKVRAYRNRKGKGSKGSGFSEADGPLAQGISHQDAPSADKLPDLREFFANVSAAKALLAEIVRRQREIEGERAKMRTMIKPEDLREAQERVKEEVEEVTLVCKRVKTKLDELDTINAQLLSEEQEEVPGDSGMQMRLSVMAGLNAKLAEVTAAWQEMRGVWVEEDRQEVAQQLHTITGRSFDASHVENLVASGGAETLYRQALSSNNVNGQAVQQLMNDVQQRHDQMRQLEHSMLELHQVFVDMSILVADQGDTINNIENWVLKTGATMQESLRHLRNAKRDRRRAAQTKAITFVTGVGLVAGGAGLTATGVGAVAGVPMILAGAAAVGGSAIGGIT